MADYYDSCKLILLKKDDCNRKILEESKAKSVIRPASFIDDSILEGREKN
jgi:hypothetical protein